MPPLVAQARASAHPPTSVPALSNSEAQSLVKEVLAAELKAAQSDPIDHPLQYRLHKVSPRYSSTKLVVETKDGDVARLLEVNNAPLSLESQQAESARLQSLLDDPSLQRHRQEREQGDAERAHKIMQALPDAFLYQYAGVVDTPQGPSYRLTFQPNPKFAPDDLEAQALKGMAGELWIDTAQRRVTRLEGRRIHDVDYGFGILGKLDEGGTLLLEQADIGNNQWRTTRMVLVMSARLLIKTVKLDTTLELSEFHPVSPGLSYQHAIELLRTAAPALPSSAEMQK
ncbi:MAG TPA: hypothetical protein VL346_11565 [Acidobacteriaceae bacterium]|nr:hypothetical protein [Acidobacteriaceae bacterium]